MEITMKRIFGLGLIVITPGLVNEVDLKVAITALMRHAGGDWGESKDKKLNDAAVKNGDDRIISVYKNMLGTTFWIITEADRSATTILLPREY